MFVGFATFDENQSVIALIVNTETEEVRAQNKGTDESSQEDAWNYIKDELTKIADQQGKRVIEGDIPLEAILFARRYYPVKSAKRRGFLVV